jgi:hypothetical protein
MARRFFGSESPVGRHFGFANFGGCGPEQTGWIEIIGVVKDVKYTSLRNEARAMYYVPFSQAILDALAALGVTEVAMPMTPMRVWRAIERAREARGTKGGDDA